MVQAHRQGWRCIVHVYPRGGGQHLRHLPVEKAHGVRVNKSGDGSKVQAKGRRREEGAARGGKRPVRVDLDDIFFDKSECNDDTHLVCVVMHLLLKIPFESATLEAEAVHCAVEISLRPDRADVSDL